jgi:hypothetical protein
MKTPPALSEKTREDENMELKKSISKKPSAAQKKTKET